MPQYNYDGMRRIHRPVRRRKTKGKPPANDHIRQLIQGAKEQNKKFTPVELKAVLDHQGHNIPLEVIIGVLNGK